MPRREVSCQPVSYASQLRYFERKEPDAAFVSKLSPKTYFQPGRSSEFAGVVGVNGMMGMVLKIGVSAVFPPLAASPLFALPADASPWKRCTPPWLSTMTYPPVESGTNVAMLPCTFPAPEPRKDALP